VPYKSQQDSKLHMILVLDFFDFITDLNDLNQSILTRNS